MKKNKNLGPGRPLKDLNFEPLIIDNNYIATNDLALELMEIFSSFANYKLLTITGPMSKKNNPQTNVRRKNVEKNQKKLREHLKIQEEYIFFLRDQEKCVIQYELINNELVEKNKFQLNQQEFKSLNIKNNILQSVELVCNQLNSNLQLFLIELIKQFSSQNQNQEKFQEDFFNYIITNPDQFKEVLSWSVLYDEAYDEKKQLLKIEIDLFKEKFIPRGMDQIKKYKVDEKRENQLKQEMIKINKLEKFQGDHKSLKKLIEDLTETIIKFWDQENI